jgi:hypothetical protein
LTAATAKNGICGNAACSRSVVSMMLAPGCLSTIRRKHGCSFDSSGGDIPRALDRPADIVNPDRL